MLSYSICYVHVLIIEICVDIQNLKPSLLQGDEPEGLEQIRVSRKKIDMFLDKSPIVDSRVFAAIHFIQNHGK